MSIDILKLSVEEIKELQSKIPKVLAEKEAIKKQNVIDQVNEIITKAGYTVNDLFPKTGKKTNKATLKAKYQNSEDKTQTWTGRGKTPKWLTEMLKTGKTKEDFII